MIDFLIFDCKCKDNSKCTLYWIRKYTFQSLLNFPKSIELYGSLINLWEGVNQGEGYLQYEKPMMKNIHSQH